MNPPSIPNRLRFLLATALLFSVTAPYAQHNANMQSLDDWQTFCPTMMTLNSHWRFISGY
ncbi:hypothetical protein ThimaDRAFT_4208 [Thiocapsa marina 5811]|uniref:Uncharacterized protein n=1 Tax=Thiocapsa marina 5811 TaxID=768671 RepID=F9UH35_9GAMM|nr:hypothetical protein ThimaDRAFT_4208 [Thiocapsa marina 5811]